MIIEIPDEIRNDTAYLQMKNDKVKQRFLQSAGGSLSKWEDITHEQLSLQALVERINQKIEEDRLELFFDMERKYDKIIERLIDQAKDENDDKHTNHSSDDIE